MSNFDKKILRFKWNSKLFEFQVLPFGLSPAPRVFTKVLKPVFSYLGERGMISFPYIDDSFVIAATVSCLCTQLVKLGFQINVNKSNLSPSNNLLFLGFHLDSTKMTVSLTDDKKVKFRNFSNFILLPGRKVIRDVAPPPLLEDKYICNYCG